MGGTSCTGVNLSSASTKISKTIEQTSDLEKTIKELTMDEVGEIKLARENAQKFKEETEMWDDPLLEVYLTELVQRIVLVAEPKRPFAYKVYLVKDMGINAFTFGGGFLYVNIGLIARMENEAQLASVLAHEVAHITKSHVKQKIKTELTTSFVDQTLKLLSIVGIATDSISAKEAALAGIFTLSKGIIMNGYSREQEMEADELGLDYLVKAGYAPKEFVYTFDLFLKEFGDPPAITNAFYGSHPRNIERKQFIQSLIDQKYSAMNSASRRPIIDSQEFQWRTRELVILTGQLLYEELRFNTARDMFLRAIDVYTGDPIPYYYLGKIALESDPGVDAADTAIVHLRDAIGANENYSPAFRELALAYYRKGDKERAIAYFERYLALAPNAQDSERIRKSLEELKNQTEELDFG